MKTQRIFALTKKELKKTVREPAALFMIFLFPVVFVLAFGLSFGGVGGGQTVTYQVGIVDLNNSQWSETFTDSLSNVTMLKVTAYGDNQTVQTDLSQGKIQAAIIVPESFSESITSYYAAPEDSSKWVNATVALYLDKGSMVATQAIPPIIQQVLNGITDQNQPAHQSPIQLQTASLEVKQVSAFDYFAPGMFTFASVFMIMIVAQSFTGDRENGMMKRIRISPTTPTEFMASQVTSYLIIALIQCAIMFGMVYALGFRPNIGLPDYAFAFILVLVFSLSNVGFGLITASIAKTSGAATGLSFLFLLPQMFLGTFVGASLSGAAEVAGKAVPSYYVTDALTSLFLRGAAITSPTVIIDFAVVLGSCIGILAVGIVIYAKYYKV
ncbi:MAG: ABC transporter permease [Candidatus Bathyarchaeota archaeon]|nr:ABC transporter permease [Candidatus Bathyarchaeota archaeon]